MEMAKMIGQGYYIWYFFETFIQPNVISISNNFRAVTSNFLQCAEAINLPGKLYSQNRPSKSFLHWIVGLDCKSSLITLKAFRAIILSKSMRKILRSGSSLRQRQMAWILLTKFALTRPKPAVRKRANLDRTAKSVQLV